METTRLTPDYKLTDEQMQAIINELEGQKILIECNLPDWRIIKGQLAEDMMEFAAEFAGFSSELHLQVLARNIAKGKAALVLQQIDAHIRALAMYAKVR